MLFVPGDNKLIKEALNLNCFLTSNWDKKPKVKALLQHIMYVICKGSVAKAIMSLLVKKKPKNQCCGRVY